MASPEEWRAWRPLVAEASAEIWRRYRTDPNVVAVGFGAATRGGRQTDDPACVVYVVRKIPAEELAPQRMLPRTVEVAARRRVDTDVVETGTRFYAHAYASRQRPMPSGISIGHKDITAGTLGGYVQDLSTGELLILSNNHVLADSNLGRAGDAIYQPGPADAPRTAASRVASLLRWVPIDFGSSNNIVDCAVALPSSVCDLSDKCMGEAMTLPTPDQPAVGLLFAGSIFDTVVCPINEVCSRLGVEMAAGPQARVGLSALTPGMPVHKTGRTTQYTTGRIWTIDCTGKINYGQGRWAEFCNQIITTAMSLGGDSGSLVCLGGSGDINPLTLLLLFCPGIILAEQASGIPFTQEWVSLDYAREKYLAPSLIGSWAIDTFYENVNQPAVVARARAQEGDIDPSDRAFVQALYAQYASEAKLALYDPDRDDLRVTEQHLAEAQEALARGRKYLIEEEAQIADEGFEMGRRLVGMNGREIIALGDDQELYQQLRQIAARAGIHDPHA